MASLIDKQSFIWTETGSRPAKGDEVYVAGEQPIAAWDNWFNRAISEDVDTLIDRMEDHSFIHENGGMDQINLEGLSVGLDKSNTITNSDSPTNFDFSGGNSRDIFTRLEVTISNSSSSNVTVDIGHQISEGSGGNGTNILVGSTNATVRANSENTVTLTTRHSEINNGTYNVSIDESNSNINVEETTIVLRSASYKFNQTDYGRFVIENGFGDKEVEINSINNKVEAFPNFDIDVGFSRGATFSRRLYSTSTDVIVGEGSASDYLSTVEDGNGRAHHYWNVAESGGDHVYRQGDNEGAAWIKILDAGTPHMDLSVAPKGSEGDQINWRTFIRGTTQWATFPIGVDLKGNDLVSNNVKIYDGVEEEIDNDVLDQNSITINAGNNLTGGGTVSLGGTVEINASDDNFLPITGGTMKGVVNSGGYNITDEGDVIWNSTRSYVPASSVEDAWVDDDGDIVSGTIKWEDLHGGPFIQANGNTSNIKHSVQDGNGRYSIYWNVDGSNHNFSDDGDRAMWFLIDDDNFAFKQSDSVGTEGESIDWSNVLELDVDYAGFGVDLHVGGNQIEDVSYIGSNHSNTSIDFANGDITLRDDGTGGDPFWYNADGTTLNLGSPSIDVDAEGDFYIHSQLYLENNDIRGINNMYADGTYANFKDDVNMRGNNISGIEELRGNNGKINFNSVLGKLDSGKRDDMVINPNDMLGIKGDLDMDNNTIWATKTVDSPGGALTFYHGSPDSNGLGITLSTATDYPENMTFSDGYRGKTLMKLKGGYEDSILHGDLEVTGNLRVSGNYIEIPGQTGVGRPDTGARIWWDYDSRKIKAINSNGNQTTLGRF